MDKEEAIKRIKDHIRVHHIGEYPHILISEALGMAISALATDTNVGDKVEVVRCKDCQHWHEYHMGSLDGLGTGMGVCIEGSNWVDGKRADDFCSYGERREGE